MSTIQLSRVERIALHVGGMSEGERKQWVKDVAKKHGATSDELAIAFAAVKLANELRRDCILF